MVWPCVGRTDGADRVDPVSFLWRPGGEAPNHPVWFRRKGGACPARVSPEWPCERARAASRPPQLALLTLPAWGPFGPSTISNSTACPSASVRNPLPAIAEKWTNTSLPDSRSMKPYPLALLNHLTLP